MAMELLPHVKPLIQRFWDICLLRKGPEDVPPLPLILLILIPVGLLLDGLRINLVVPGIPGYQLFISLLAYTLAMMLIIASLLMLFGYRQRIVQTLIALSGSGLVLTALILPFDFLVSLHPQRFTMASLIILLMHLWSLVVVGHILARSLSVHRLMGVIIAFGYLMLGFSVFQHLMPGSF